MQEIIDMHIHVGHRFEWTKVRRRSGWTPGLMSHASLTGKRGSCRRSTGMSSRRKVWLPASSSPNIRPEQRASCLRSGG